VREARLGLDRVGWVCGAPSSAGAAPTPGFVGGGGTGAAGNPSMMIPEQFKPSGTGTPPQSPVTNNSPRDDPRVPKQRHQVPPGVTPPPWLGGPPAAGSETPAATPSEPTPPPDYVPPPVPPPAVEN
jgi:hypothetical protein